MSKVVASLSEQGWVTDSSKILSNLFAYYILTDGAQTLVFKGNLINLPATYHQYLNDPDSMRAAIKSDLDKLLSRYFTDVDVATTVKALTDSQYAILLYATVVDDDGVKIELSKVVQIDTTGLRKVIDVNNYGDGEVLLHNL